MKRPSQALIDTWYAKLRAEGFRDIELGRDPDRWTFRSTQRKSCHDATQVPYMVSWPSRLEPQAELADHPTAVYYREMEHAARSLKGERRKLILLASNVDASKVARALGRKRNGTGKLVRRFALEIGLRREAHGS